MSFIFGDFHDGAISFSHFDWGLCTALCMHEWFKWYLSKGQTNSSRVKYVRNPMMLSKIYNSQHFIRSDSASSERTLQFRFKSPKIKLHYRRLLIYSEMHLLYTLSFGALLLMMLNIETWYFGVKNKNRKKPHWNCRRNQAKYKHNPHEKKQSQTFLKNMKENILFVFRLFFANLLSLCNLNFSTELVMVKTYSI